MKERKKEIGRWVEMEERERNKRGANMWAHMTEREREPTRKNEERL